MHQRRMETWPMDTNNAAKSLEENKPHHDQLPGQDLDNEIPQLAMDAEQDDDDLPLEHIQEHATPIDTQDVILGMIDVNGQDFQVLEFMGFQKAIPYKAPTSKRSVPIKARPHRFLCRYKEAQDDQDKIDWFDFDPRSGDKNHVTLEVYTKALEKARDGLLDEYSNSIGNPKLICSAEKVKGANDHEAVQSARKVAYLKGNHLSPKDRLEWASTMAEVGLRIRQIQNDITGDPKSRKQMLRMEQQHVQGFIDGELKELKDFERVGLWTLVDPATVPTGTKILGTQWIYVRKNNGIYRSRCVVQGNRQKVGKDVFQTFSPTARLKTTKIMTSVGAQRNYKDRQVDFSVAFLTCRSLTVSILYFYILSPQKG